MLRGVFNSIIYAGRLTRAFTAAVGRRLVAVFNAVANDNPAEAREAKCEASPEGNRLRHRFNNCNDNLGFDGQNEAKEARVQALINMLREIARRVAEGSAMALDAMGIVCELESLGIHVSGLPLYAPGAPIDHTKTVPAPVPGPDFYRPPAFAM
jgi:hypothetical protein